MRQVSEVLRLSAQSFVLSPATVGRYRVRYRNAGISRPLPEDLDVAVLEPLLFRLVSEDCPDAGAALRDVHGRRHAGPMPGCTAQYTFRTIRREPVDARD